LDIPVVLGYQLDRAEKILRAHGCIISITYIDSFSTDSGNGQDRVLRMKKINNRVELLVGKC
jgi:hypothetical protein